MAELTTPNAVLTESPAEANIAVIRLRAAMPDTPIRAVSMFGQDWAIVPADAIIDACRLLRDDEATRFDSLIDVTAVDLLPVTPRWEVVYQLLSMSRNVRFRLKVEVEDGPDPEVPSVTSAFQTANWYEREIFDLMGIRFPGHPALRRILLPDDWQGFPLRYDHPIGGEEVGFTS
jgi:NADH-quinone oxidoreductase subunit C